MTPPVIFCFIFSLCHNLTYVNVRKSKKTGYIYILSNYFNTSYLLSTDFSSQQILLFIIISLVYFLLFLGLSIADILNKDIVK